MKVPRHQKSNRSQVAVQSLRKVQVGRKSSAKLKSPKQITLQVSALVSPCPCTLVLELAMFWLDKGHWMLD